MMGVGRVAKDMDRARHVEASPFGAAQGAELGMEGAYRKPSMAGTQSRVGKQPIQHSFI